MINWEKELKLIESLGKLYPEFSGIYGCAVIYKNYKIGDNDCKVSWVLWLCKYHLNQRIPCLEKFIKENNRGAWFRYKDYFEIKN